MSGDRGAAAVAGPSGLANAEDDAMMGRLLLQRVGEGQSLGQALRSVKRELAASSPYMVDVILGVNLLGDPALVVEP